MKKRRSVHRMNIRLDLMTMGALCQALEVRYKVPTAKERGRFIRLAILAYSSAVAKQGEQYNPGLLACELRPETPWEYHYRTAEHPGQQQLPAADNIVALFG